MSATGRGAERAEADYYPTPAWCTQRLLAATNLPTGDWLEPSAGSGHIVRVIQAMRPDVRLATVELRPECRPGLAALKVPPLADDFLRFRPARGFHVCIGNPPYLLAQEFVEQALTLAERVVFLLRIGFLESQKREAFYRRVGMPDVMVLPERPSFDGKGTDATAYAWFHWKRDRTQEGKVHILYAARGR
jgi:hypothetical protein